MKIPDARGPISGALFRLLADGTGADSAAQGTLLDLTEGQLALADDLIDDGDVQLTLFASTSCITAAWTGWTTAGNGTPGCHTPAAAGGTLRAGAAVRGPLVRRISPACSCRRPGQRRVADILFGLAGQDGGPDMSRHVAKKATLGQLREFLVHKSIYQLKEADPHTWAIPRLTGRAKAALVEIQADEYGGGRPDRMHSALFARTMRGLGLDDVYGAYVDAVPAISLAAVNMMSLFGLNRRLRGAIAGHLAIYEMTSSRPNQQYGNGFRRLGFGADVTAYFDEHVEADAVHEQIAGRDLAGGLVEAEPDLLSRTSCSARRRRLPSTPGSPRTSSGRGRDGTSSLKPPVPAGV